MVGVKQGGKATFVKSVPTGLKAIKAEVQGLNLLRTFILQHQIPYLQIPTVFSSDEINIELERIDSHQPTFEQFRQFGQGLAKLHNVQAARYGLGQDNFIGLAPQLNAWSSDWGEFFLSKRLQQQVEWITNHKIREEFRQTLKQVGKKLSSFLNEHCAHASLLHGDLWQGNVMFDQEGVWLIDPAVYFGDSEADLAMTELFGGFPPDFYRSYQAIRPLSQAYEIKCSIYNLYHNLNHYNLFGDHYLSGCRQGLTTITQL